MAEAAAASSVENDRPLAEPKFFCHLCKQEIKPLMPELVCPLCQSGFVEQLENGLDAASLCTGMQSVPQPDTSLCPPEVIETLFLLFETSFYGLPEYAQRQRRLNRTRQLGRNRLPRTSEESDQPELPANEETDVNRSALWLSQNRHLPLNAIFNPYTLLRDATVLNPMYEGIDTEEFRQPFSLNLHSSPEDYVWGQGGLDAIITQFLNEMNIAGPPPLVQKEIEEIPLVKITLDQVDKALQCTVCMEDFIFGESVRELTCQHHFHSDCIVPWLKLHATCPICRMVLSKETPESVSSPDTTTPSNACNVSATASSSNNNISRNNTGGSSSSSSSSSSTTTNSGGRHVSGTRTGYRRLSRTRRNSSRQTRNSRSSNNSSNGTSPDSN